MGKPTFLALGVVCLLLAIILGFSYCVTGVRDSFRRDAVQQISDRQSEALIYKGSFVASGVYVKNGLSLVVDGDSPGQPFWIKVGGKSYKIDNTPTFRSKISFGERRSDTDISIPYIDGTQQVFVAIDDGDGADKMKVIFFLQ